MAVLSVIDNRIIFQKKIEPYNQALALVGHDPVKTLEDVLSNSDACAALSANDEANAIMKNNYRSEMEAAIESKWNEGLNALNYACKLKCYLYNAGNQCNSITGGWDAKWSVVLAGATQRASVNNSGTIYMYFRRTNGDGLYRDTCNAHTNKSIDATGYAKIKWNVTEISSKGKKQFMYDGNFYHTGVTTAKTHSFAANSGVQKFIWTDVPHENIGEQTCRISAVWLDPADGESDPFTSDLDSAILDNMVLS